LSSLLGGMSAGLLLRRCRDDFGSWGSLESGANLSSRGDSCRRRRVWLQGRRSLGRVPDRWTFSVIFISFVMASVYGGSSQSHVAMELLPTWVWWQWLLMVSGGGWRQRSPEASVRGGPRDLFVISLFFKGLYAIMVEQLSSVSYLTVSVFVRVFGLYP
jgi:hypothetical protein